MDGMSAFEQKLSGFALSGFIGGAIAIAHRLGLLKVLSDVSSAETPATAELVANVANCKPRYVKELFALLTSADIIEVNEDEKFWIKPENVETLTSKSWGIIHNLSMADMIQISGQLSDCFRNNGPYGMEYSSYNGVCDMIGEHSEILHKKHLISSFLPRISPDLTEKLEKGDMMVLDVGCGNGFHASFLAEHFPKSNFTGLDVTLDAVRSANERRKNDGKTFENLAFIQMNAAKMDDDWTDKYDLVLIFDACHDQTRPDLCLKEIKRILKPDGVFAMLETVGVSNIYQNKKSYGPLATMLYSFSVFHCLPVASNSPDAICAGTMWGREMATKMLNDAGFSSVEIIDSSYMLTAGMHVGYKLRLFEAVKRCSNETNHATVEEIAEEAKCKPRYIKEWLAIMATGDIIEVDSEDRFWIKNENIEVLLERTHEVSPSSLLIDNDVFVKVVECMKLTGPNGLRPEAYKWKPKILRDPCDHWKYVEEVESMCVQALDTELFKRLKNGQQTVLEIGCSSGAHLAVFATILPENNYVGVDIDACAIGMAKQRRPSPEIPFKNLQFMEMDGSDLPDSWDVKYDIIFIHFSCHDMSRPDKCFLECYRVLNEKGVLIMIDSACASTIYENKKLYGMAALVQYSVSLFQCLPLASNDDNSIALGAMCSKNKLLDMIYGAGFARVNLQHLDKMPSATLLYLAHKK